MYYKAIAKYQDEFYSIASLIGITIKSTIIPIYKYTNALCIAPNENGLYAFYNKKDVIKWIKYIKSKPLSAFGNYLELNVEYYMLELNIKDEDIITTGKKNELQIPYIKCKKMEEIKREKII